MTSKNYLCRSVKENLRRNFYLLVLSALAFLTALPVFGIMQMEGLKHADAMEGSLLTPLQEAFLNSVGPKNEIMWIVVIAAAILLGLAGFSYLYSGEKIDFYHSLPLKREQLFLVSFVSNLLIFLVPYLLSPALTYVAGVAYGAVTAQAFRAMWAAIGIHLLYFLVIYAAVILAVLLTGNLFTGILGIAGFLSYGLLVYAAYNFMNGRFFGTLAQLDNSAGSYYLSPLSAYLYTLESYIAQKHVGGCLWYGIILAVVLVATDVWVYKIRPSESFQKAIAFRKLQPVIKVFCVVPLSLLAGLLFSSGMERRFIWMALSVLLVAVLLSAAFEFLYTMDIRKCIRPKTSTGIALAAVVLILAGYRMDVAGVDSYLPSKEKVKSMSIYVDDINGNMDYPDSAYYSVGTYLDKNRIEDFEAVYELAKRGVEYYKENVSSTKNSSDWANGFYLTDVNGQVDDTVAFYIAYHLKSGKDVYRCYFLPETEEVVKAVGEVYDNWEYREKALPTYYLKEDRIEYLYVVDCYDARKPLELTDSRLTNLYKTYQSELENMTFAQSMKTDIIAYLSAEYEIKNDDGSTYRNSCELPIYENFSATRSFLETEGISLPDHISAEEVADIKLFRYENNDTQKEAVFSEPKEIETILKHLTFANKRYHVGLHWNHAAVNVEINWKNGSQGTQTRLSLKNSKELEPILEKLNKD